MTGPLRFGRFEIDLATRELREDGVRLQLSPKIFDCIAYLIEHRDRAVGRDELMSAVWARADMTDSQLGQAILKARRVLGDSGEAQHSIRTIAGFGYRWVAEVAELAAAAPPPMPEPVRPVVDAADPVPSPSAAHTAPRRRFTRHKEVGAGMLLLAVLALAWAGWCDTHPSARPPARTTAVAAPASAAPLVAVLPARIDAAGEWDWLRLGLMEFVASHLRSSGQVVAPSENVVPLIRTAPGAAALPATVRGVLDARWLVQPEVRHTDHGWTVTLELDDGGAPARAVSGQAADPVGAARIAGDRLLDVLGATAPAPDGTNRQLVEIVSHIDAALLADDPATAREVLRGAPAALLDAPELRLRAAETEFAQGRLDAAGAELERLLADLGAESRPLLRARALSLDGAVRIMLSRAAEALAPLGAALDLLHGGEDPALLGKTWMRAGVAHSLLRHDERAVAAFAQARIALQLAGDTLGPAQVDFNEGALDGTRNHHADALEHFRRAGREFERFGIQGEFAGALNNQVVAHRALLQPAEALAASARAMALLGVLPSPQAAHLVRLRRAQALVDAGQWTAAGSLLDELARAIDPRSEPQTAAMVAAERALLALERGEAERAAGLAAPVAAEADVPALASTRVAAWMTLARAQRLLGRPEAAAAAVAELLAWGGTPEGSGYRSSVLLAQAEQALAEHRLADADRLHAEALREVNVGNVPQDIAEVVCSWGAALIARGDLVEATPVVGQVAQLAERHFASASLQARLYQELGQAESARHALARARELAGERPLPLPASGAGAAPTGGR
ncbi:MAG: winged helix-turn-helix domain-containing protein [Xanthomonadales bacterium]|nr:winged helix-turn-helix domain-containing protein [Xanthomonadales bacterium]